MRNDLVRIFIADDDPEDLELIEDAILLAAPSAELVKFGNGLSAYEYMSTRKDSELPCLIVLDYNMPQLNGAQLLSSINREARYKKIPKIVLSTSNTPYHIRECLDNGATEYVVKPDNIKELHKLAKKLVALCQ